MRETIAVTGAFGYLGKYIAEILLAQGKEVLTLTNSPDRPDPFGGRVMARPFHFDARNRLIEELAAVHTLYNTYWIRYPYANFTFQHAVDNSKMLIDCAQEAGVKRFVHVSIANASPDSKLAYVQAKAEVEEHLRCSCVPHTIVRPTVLFGKEDVLINNLAWAARRLPVLAYFGSGEYRLQPVYVEDLAELLVREGEQEGNRLVNARGIETYTYKELLKMISGALGRRRLLMPVPASVGYLASAVLGKLMGDVVMTREELAGLMDELLYVDDDPIGIVKLSDWINSSAATLGRGYKNDLLRRINRRSKY